MPNVIVSAAGVQGPRGNTILSGIGAPTSAVGVDGDFYFDKTNFPSSVVLYGPRVAGLWPSSGVTVGGTAGALVAANNLSDVLSASVARTNLGLGSAATQAAGAFDAFGAASAAQSGAIADAATKYQPLQPWVFDVVRAYGAKGDGQIVTDGVMASGSAVVTSASGKFGNVTANMLVMAKGAGATGVTTLVATAASKQSSNQITLNAVNATGTALTGLTIMWASDDTTAIQSAINDAVAYAQSHGGAATVLIPAALGEFYGIGGPLVTTASGNAQLTIPVVSSTGNKLVLTFQGAGDGAAVQYWQQVPPQMSGSTLVSFGVFAGPSAQATSITNHGNPSLLGGPSQPGGYGVAPGVYTNVDVVMRGLSLRTTHSADGLGYTAMDFDGCANAALHDVGYGSLGTVANGDFGNPGVFGTGLSIGLLMPASGNNDLCILDNVTCHGGYTYAAFVTEHTDMFGVRLLYCWAGLCPVGLYFGSVGSVHAIRGFVSVEACHYHLYIVGGGSGGVGPFLHLLLDTEGTVLFGDNGAGAPSAAAKGQVILTGEVTLPITIDHPPGFDIVNDQVSFATAAVSSAYTLTPLDEVVEVTGTTTVTLPTAVGRARRVVIVNVGTGTVTVATTGGQTISGSATKTLASQWSSLEAVPSPSGNWTQIA
ncbi:hypothetical protein [Streptacidiphilus carbonis]|uniref:hypothetical protein n=1 Tax=Streptacidiphilus carbonis TaxID=105422 RepID=UPI0005AA1B02|nr:hypothetical protein [Streptacidiphilus carbonis]